MMRARVLDLQQWKVNVLLMVGGEIYDVPDVTHRRCKMEVEVTNADRRAIGKTWMWDGIPRFVWVRDRDDMAVLGHELLHVVFGVLTTRGMELSAASEEAYTYLFEDLMRQATSRKGWQRP